MKNEMMSMLSVAGSAGRKKLLIVTTVPDTLEFILESQPQFLNQYYQVVVVSSEPVRLEAFAVKEGVSFVSVEMARGISMLKDVISVFKMYRVMRKQRPDVVHSYTPKAGMVCAIAGFLARVPVRIHTFTGLIFPYCSGLKHRVLKFIDTLVCCLNTHIVPEGKGVLADLTPICHKPMSVIGHGNIAGVDLTYFVANQPEVLAAAAALTAQYQLQDKQVFCFVGRLNRDKGIKELCQAFTQLNPEHHALLVVGGLDTENPVDDATVQLLQQAPSIHWLGFQADVRIALAAADVFVLPSYREGFPNVVLQAAAMAKPALVTNVSGSNEIVQHGFNGWIAAPKDAQALLEQLRDISQMSDTTLAEKGQNALRLVQERFDRKGYQVQLLKFYQGIVS
jgi:glycosyltransferase involved in cell wall biosynthesis